MKVVFILSIWVFCRYEADMLIDRPGINIKERDFDERSFFVKLFRPLPVATKFSGNAVKVLTFLLGKLFRISLRIS